MRARLLAVTSALALAVPAMNPLHRSPSAEVSVTARDYALEMPDTIAAGLVTFRFTNAGKDFHHLWIVRLDAGKSATDFVSAMKSGGPMPAWAHDVGGPNAPMPQGGVSNATVRVAPGQYIAMCLVQTQPDMQPHAMKGMLHPFVVVSGDGATQSGGARPDLTLTVADYAFAFDKPVAAGHHVIRVLNKGTQTHEVELVQLDSGKTPQDLIAWLDKPNGPPPARAIGGVTGIAAGYDVSFEADLAAGEYGLICFVPDAKDGKPHFMHGMTHQFSVR